MSLQHDLYPVPFLLCLSQLFTYVFSSLFIRPAKLLYTPKHILPCTDSLVPVLVYPMHTLLPVFVPPMDRLFPLSLCIPCTYSPPCPCATLKHLLPPPLVTPLDRRGTLEQFQSTRQCHIILIQKQRKREVTSLSDSGYCHCNYYGGSVILARPFLPSSSSARSRWRGFSPSLFSSV